MRERSCESPSQRLTPSVLVERNANARNAIEIIASRMHDGLACAGRGQFSVTLKYGTEGL